MRKQNGQEDSAPTGTQEATDTAEPNGPGEGDEAADGNTAPSTEPESAQPNGMQMMFPNPMGFNMPGGFPNMGWNGSGDFNPMAQFMSNGMFNPQNPMGKLFLPQVAHPSLFDTRAVTDSLARYVWDGDGPNGRESRYVRGLRDENEWHEQWHEQWHEHGDELRCGAGDVWGMGRLSEQYVEWRPR